MSGQPAMPRRCRKIKISATQADLEYWDFRVAEARGRGEESSRSQILRRITHESQALRHDLATPRQTVRWIIEMLRLGILQQDELPELLKNLDASLERIGLEPPKVGDCGAA